MAEATSLREPVAPPQHGGSRQSGARTLVVGSAIAFVLLAAGLAGWLVSSSSSPGPEVAPGISPQAAYLLRLDVFGTNARPKAPNFALTDQSGRTVSLSAFRGRSVVLSFNDDRCTDICTLLAQDVVAASRDLGTASKQVEFVAINVNPYYPSVAAVSAWSNDHGLGHLGGWNFLTGSPDQLRRVWGSYGVQVVEDPSAQTVDHSTELFFIGPNGREAALGSYGSAAADTTVFAHTMAEMANDLLPRSLSTQVGGPSYQTSNGEASIGSLEPGFSLPMLGNPKVRLSSADLRGHYTVLNFWSTSCSACVNELPALESTARQLRGEVRVVGVDVGENRSSAEAFVRRAGVTYDLVSDPSGDLAASYGVTGLPTTAIIAPRGTVEVVHPGSFGTEALEYVVKNLVDGSQ
ncbi:MAG: redoxin domain-containing protein [Acidimicrobiales bacterium]